MWMHIGADCRCKIGCGNSTHIRGRSARFWGTTTRRVLASPSARCPLSTLGGWTEQILGVIYSRICLKIHAGPRVRRGAPRYGTNVFGVIYTRLLKNSISPTMSVTAWKPRVGVCLFWLIKFRGRERHAYDSELAGDDYRMIVRISVSFPAFSYSKFFHCIN